MSDSKKKETSLLEKDKGQGGNIFKKKLFQALVYIKGHFFFQLYITFRQSHS